MERFIALQLHRLSLRVFGGAVLATRAANAIAAMADRLSNAATQREYAGEPDLPYLKQVTRYRLPGK